MWMVTGLPRSTEEAHSWLKASMRLQVVEWPGVVLVPGSGGEVLLGVAGPWSWLLVRHGWCCVPLLLTPDKGPRWSRGCGGLLLFLNPGDLPFPVLMNAL